MSSQSSFSSVPTPTQNPNPNFNKSPVLGSSPTLYLYTFVATLVVLLGVSTLVVIRTHFLRRRQRLIMEEAIRNGTWVPPPSLIRDERNEKPVLHDVYLHHDWLEEREDHDDSDLGKQKQGEAWWKGKDLKASMPLAVARPCVPPVPPPFPTLSQSFPSWVQRLIPNSKSTTAPSDPAPAPSTRQTLRIAYLVRMPASSLKSAIPPMEFGIVTARTEASESV